LGGEHAGREPYGTPYGTAPYSVNQYGYPMY
jgi:hypothetical protein